ncbi:hypothetical protein ACFLV2_01530 [Chloroflexota bacterium]
MDNNHINTDMASQLSLFLCFNGDGPYWDNILHIPEYPSGYSYFRPFRYRDKWIQNSLLIKIQNEQTRKKLIGAQVVLCMALRAEERIILPIRQAVIRHIDPMPDNQSVYFSMGPMYDFTKINTLIDSRLNIGKSGKESIGISLFFEMKSEIPNAVCNSEVSEDNSWVAYTDLIGNEATLPISEEAKQSLFIRFRGLGRKKLTDMQCIYKSWSSGEVQGAVLSEGTSYELVYFHRVPSLISKDISLKKSMITYKVPSGNLELSRSEEELTGNYQKHVLSISANKPSGTWEEIVIEFTEKLESQTGMTINAEKSSLPLKVKISHWYRFFRTYIWVLMIWASLSINVVIENLLEGKTDWNLIIASALIAVFSAIGIFMLQQKNPSK